MSRAEIFGVCFATAIVVVGLTLGILCDGTYFARSGSLLVVVAIVLGMFDIPHKLSSVSSWFESQISTAKAKAVSEIDPNGKDPLRADAAAEAAIAETRKGLETIVARRRRNAVLTEGVMLIIGTLIWGFGDLIGKVSVCQC